MRRSGLAFVLAIVPTQAVAALVAPPPAPPLPPPTGNVVRLYNVRLFDAGEQFVKGTVDFASPNGVDDGIVEYSVIEYTTIGPGHGYTNGFSFDTPLAPRPR